jgi:uncharacterized damage-inducible protein DinB
MDILERLLAHDAWTTGQVLLCCRQLTDMQMDREFDMGLRSLRRTLLHIIGNMEVWHDLVAGVPLRPNQAEKPGGSTVEGMLLRLETVAGQLKDTATAIACEGRLDQLWVDHLDDPPTKKTYGGAIAHVITHSMHHRAQALYMLRRLGLHNNLPEGDVLSWEAQAQGPDMEKRHV